MRKQRLPRDERRRDRGEWREQQDAPPLKGEPDQESESDQNPEEADKIRKTHDSGLREQNVKIGRRSLPDVIAVLRQKGVRAAPAFLFQHCQELTLCVELRRGAELSQLGAHDAVRTHSCPSGALSMAGIRYLTQ